MKKAEEYFDKYMENLPKNVDSFRKLVYNIDKSLIIKYIKEIQKDSINIALSISNTQHNVNYYKNKLYEEYDLNKENS